MTPTDIRIEGILAHIIQYIIYQLWFQIFALHDLARWQRMMQRFGTLNETHRGRDQVPDKHKVGLVLCLLLFSFVRNIGVFILGKDRAASVPNISIWSPVKIGLFTIAMDYFFYVYHRSTHQVRESPHIKNP